MIKINFRYVRTRTAAPGADTYHTTKLTFRWKKKIAVSHSCPICKTGLDHNKEKQVVAYMTEVALSLEKY